MGKPEITEYFSHNFFFITFYHNNKFTLTTLFVDNWIMFTTKL